MRFEAWCVRIASHTRRQGHSQRSRNPQQGGSCSKISDGSRTYPPEVTIPDDGFTQDELQALRPDKMLIYADESNKRWLLQLHGASRSFSWNKYGWTGSALVALHACWESWDTHVDMGGEEPPFELPELPKAPTES
eukprot:1062067-Amphidinium_carterae.1